MKAHLPGRLALAVAALLSFGSGLRAEPLIVFAAASLKDGLDAALTGWEPGGVTVSYASTAALARQIDQGAPADLFIGASPDWMDWLEARGALRPGSRSDLLTNALVLVATGSGPGSTEVLTPRTDLPARLGDGYLAMALVDAVPAGIYGKQALEATGHWPRLEGRVVQTDNVRAALALVARGEAALGIVYRTDAMAEPDVQVVALFDPADHDAIVYPAAVTARSTHPQVDMLADYLRGPAASAAFVAAGFGLAR